MDHLNIAERSWNMSRIKSKHTLPEKIVRRCFAELGIRYRLHVSKLPGRPDVVIGRSKMAIFVNGCFWHQHQGCKRQSVPKSNAGYWVKKLESNIKKQKIDIRELKKLGWKVFVIWECDTKNGKKLSKAIKKIYEFNNFQVS